VGRRRERMGHDGGSAVRPGAGRSCELCGAPAAVHCAADAAFLCAASDTKVHDANFLASRHCRMRMSDVWFLVPFLARGSAGSDETSSLGAAPPTTRKL
jgi:hypothetical protein